ncbi:MAG: hypothetical protein KDD78_10610 [Caldilineaceae bacterium]|nr:hypothetical protein [Caldilineaceae bacterium]
MANEQRYLAYMVRLWTVRCNGDVVWRASAANAHSGEQRTFADLASLFDFFRDVVADEPCSLGQLRVGSEEE